MAIHNELSQAMIEGAGFREAGLRLFGNFTDRRPLEIVHKLTGSLPNHDLSRPMPQQGTFNPPAFPGQPGWSAAQTIPIGEDGQPSPVSPEQISTLNATYVDAYNINSTTKSDPFGVNEVSSLTPRLIFKPDNETDQPIVGERGLSLKFWHKVRNLSSRTLSSLLTEGNSPQVELWLAGTEKVRRRAA